MRLLQPAPDFHTLLDDPLGRYAFGDRFGGWALAPQLAGFVTWGRLQSEDSDALFAVFDRPLAPTMKAPCDVVFDARRIQGIDTDSFDYFVRGSMARRPIFEQRIRRQAIVRPPGLLGAAAEGIAKVFLPSYQWSVFGALADALAWLDCPDAEAQARAIEALVDVAVCGSPVVARLRAWLSARGARATIQEASLALGLSARSLQRTLGEAGATFRSELDRARIERAKELLLDGNLKLETIAEKIGCASLPGFSAFFRRMTRTTPSAFRARGKLEA